MEGARRCEDCRRIIKGVAGDSCPYCGGSHLVAVAIAPPVTPLRHGSVLTAVITFCLGLSLLRVVLVALGSKSFASPAYGDMLWQLQLLTAFGALVYIVLRRSEGDFRALFLVSLALFVGTEVTAALARDHGLLSLSRLSTLLNMGLFIFSVMTFTAAIPDLRRPDRYRVCLLIALTGFLFLSALRTFFQVKSREFDERASSTGIVVLAAVLLCVGVMLIKREFSGRTAPAPAAQPAEAEAESIKSS
ncbi:MAG TPA: hypothetical protein VEK08_24350 [Planctomycetota bacterium]|nr:hypothetical protein [Planctomycetota bacterium]